jgi:hypothetical protein
MALFLNLYLGHLLGDFLLQPGRLVLAKRDGIPGLLVHTLIVGAASAAVMFATIGSDWWAVVLVTGLHLVVERLTILTYVKTPTRGLFTLLFDQTLHMLCIAGVVWIAGGWTLDASAMTLGLEVPVPRLAAIDGLRGARRRHARARRRLLSGSHLASGRGGAGLHPSARVRGHAPARAASGAAGEGHDRPGALRCGLLGGCGDHVPHERDVPDRHSALGLVRTLVLGERGHAPDMEVTT